MRACKNHICCSASSPAVELVDLSSLSHLNICLHMRNDRLRGKYPHSTQWYLGSLPSDSTRLRLTRCPKGTRQATACKVGSTGPASRWYEYRAVRNYCSYLSRLWGILRTMREPRIYHDADDSYHYRSVTYRPSAIPQVVPAALNWADRQPVRLRAPSHLP
jgi:hypothetical protein